MSTPGDTNQQQPGQGYGQGPDQTYGQAYGQAYAQGQPQYAPRPPGSDDRFWAPAAHWSALATWLVTGALAFVPPLVIMLTKGQSSPVVRRHAVASLNFQLSMLMYAVVSGIVALVGFVLSFVLIGIPILILAGLALVAVLVTAFVLPIVAAVKANNGEEYSYPFTISLVS